MKALVIGFLLIIGSASHASQCDWLFQSERHLLENIEQDWSAKLVELRKLPKPERVPFLKAYSSKLESELKKIASRPAVHFNLHGGRWTDYIQGGGIQATMGDVALQYGLPGDTRHKVYFYNFEHFDLYRALTTQGIGTQFFRGRMGSAAIFFDLDSPAISNVTEEDEIALNFGPRIEREFYGVPA